MHLAYVTVPGRGRTDGLIAAAVKAFEADGLRLAGTVRSRPADPRAHPCDMDLRVLPDGPHFRISQPLGKGARGCRLDGGVIETIAGAVEDNLARAEIMVVNKFGKREAQGRGLGPAIAMAIEMGVPTLVGVSQMCLPDFTAFAANQAVPLPADLRAVRAWYETVQARRVPAMV